VRTIVLVGSLLTRVNNVESVPNQVSKIIVSALNQNLVEFELKPGIRVIVYFTQLTLGKTPFCLLWRGKYNACTCNGIICMSRGMIVPCILFMNVKTTQQLLSACHC
jgi:hypothetical protein